MTLQTLPTPLGLDSTLKADDPVLEDVLVDVDWSAMDSVAQREFYATNGFLVVPGAMADAALTPLLAHVEGARWTDQSESIWDSDEVVGLIDNAPLLAAARAAIGDSLKLFKGAYAQTPPRESVEGQGFRQALHVDYGIGEEDGDLRNSVASWLKVVWYLTPLAPEHTPLWVVPGSHNLRHLSPGSDMESLAPRARMILTEPGDAILWGGDTVHAGGCNDSARTSRALCFSYRAGWTRPAASPATGAWSAELLDRCSPAQLELLSGLASSPA